MQINPKTFQAYSLFHRGTQALTRAELQGIRVDVDYIEKSKRRLTRRIEYLEEEFKNTKFFKHWEHTIQGKVNIYSNQQLSNFLYKTKKIKIQKETISGQGATDEETLKLLNMPELDILLKIRKLKKIRDTYLDSFLREQINGVIHPFFNLNLVRTYRSSSDRPNMQNTPKRDNEAMLITRKALYPRFGHQLLEVDFSSLEVRISCAYHKDPTMLQYMNDPKSDMHRDMAQQIFMLKDFSKSIPGYNTMRQAAKNGWTFPQFYGSYYANCAGGICDWVQLPQTRWKPEMGIDFIGGTIAEHLIAKGIKSFDGFTNHLKTIESDFWGNRFKVYARWKDAWYTQYLKTGYIDMLTGFRCYGPMSKNDVTNYCIQGAAFHCLLWSLIEMDRIIIEERLDTRIIGQIHDSMILDCNPNELDYIAKIVRRVTCTDLPNIWKWINVPMDIDADLCPVDTSWVEKQHYIL